MGAKDKKRRVLGQVVVVFIAGLVGSVVFSRLIPRMEWAAILPMGLAVGISCRTWSR